LEYEISNLYNRTPPITADSELNSGTGDIVKSNSKSRNNSRILSFLMVIILIVLFVNQQNFNLSKIQSLFSGYDLDQSVVDPAFWETSPAATENEFWHIVNPLKEDQYAEIRPTRYLTLFDDNNIKDSDISTKNPHHPDEWKSSVKTSLRSLIWFFKFVILPVAVIVYTIYSLVDYLLPLDPKDKDIKSSIGSNSSMGNTIVLSSSGYLGKNIISPKVTTLRGRHLADVDLLCANANGMIISTAMDKHITSWNGRQGISLKKLERYMRRCESCKCGVTGGMKKCISWPVRAMCMSEKVEWAAAGFEDGVVRVWNIHSGQATYILKDTVEDVESVVSVMTGNLTKERVTCLQIIVPNSSSMNNTPSQEHGYPHFATDSNHKTPAMLLSTYKSGYFREWDLISGQIVHTVPTNQKGGISYLCVVDDGKQDYDQDELRIYTGARDGSVKCWIRTIYYSENEPINSHIDPKELRRSRWKSPYTIPGEPGNPITSVAAKTIKTQNGYLGIVVTGASDGEVRVYEYLTGTHIETLSQGTIGKKRHHITNIIIHPLKKQSCPCGITKEAGGFAIITSSGDERVHVWQLIRSVMDCTCMAFKLKQPYIQNPFVNISEWYQRIEQFDRVASYQTKFIGRVSQPGGSAIVFLRENIIGARRVKNSRESVQTQKRCHGAEGEWELWILDINDAQTIEKDREHDDLDEYEEDVELTVQVVPLVTEKDLVTEEKQKMKKEEIKRRDKESVGELKGFVQEDTQGQVVDFRQRSPRHRVYPDGKNDRQLALLEEEDEMNELLPFAYIRQVVGVGDDGVAVAY
ncbi:1484_t:CDS:2, partial [Acaulospora morrowiae]